MVRRSMSLRPIHRIKHIIDANGAVLGTTLVHVPIAVADDNPVLANVTECETGSKLNGFYIHIEVSHTSGVGRPMTYMILWKNPGANVSQTIMVPNAMGLRDSKNLVIHQEMLLMSGDAGNGLPRPLFNGVIAIPKGMRRMAPGDQWLLTFMNGTATVDSDWCLQVHYKEFR